DDRRDQRDAGEEQKLLLQTRVMKLRDGNAEDRARLRAGHRGESTDTAVWLLHLRRLPEPRLLLRITRLLSEARLRLRILRLRRRRRITRGLLRLLRLSVRRR